MKYTVVFIFSQNMSQVLMIDKTKGPYPGCLNGVGGKIDVTDITEEYGALREVEEETGLTQTDIEPLSFLTRQIFPNGVELNVYYTKIKHFAVAKQMEEEVIGWYNTKELLDVTNPRLAGEGNIAYFLNYALILEMQYHASR